MFRSTNESTASVFLQICWYCKWARFDRHVYGGSFGSLIVSFVRRAETSAKRVPYFTWSCQTRCGVVSLRLGGFLDQECCLCFIWMLNIWSDFIFIKVWMKILILSKRQHQVSLCDLAGSHQQNNFRSIGRYGCEPRLLIRQKRWENLVLVSLRKQWYGAIRL